MQLKQAKTEKNPSHSIWIISLNFPSNRFYWHSESLKRGEKVAWDSSMHIFFKHWEIIWWKKRERENLTGMYGQTPLIFHFGACHQPGPCSLERGSGMNNWILSTVINMPLHFKRNNTSLCSPQYVRGLLVPPQMPTSSTGGHDSWDWHINWIQKIGVSFVSEAPKTWCGDESEEKIFGWEEWMKGN